MDAVNFLLDRPLVLFVVLAIGAAIGIALERVLAAADREKRRAYWRGRNANSKARGKTHEKDRGIDRTADMATDQLNRVMRAKFTARTLLNRPEGKVFKALDSAVVARNPGWQVMAQVSLGEFLASPDRDAYGCVNSKRVDFALMDPDCRVRHALEYQGNGHHQNAAAARDAVKKEALRKAGIGYHEVVAGHTTPAELKRLVEKLVPNRDAV